MAKYQKYAEYKDSGVEWLGEIPSHWDYFDGKRIFSSVRKQALSSDEQLAASQKYGVIPQNLMMQLNDSKVMLALKGTESFRHVEKNNFVISLRSFEGGIEHSNYEGCVSPAYTVLSSKKNIDYRYFKYLFKSAPFIAALQSTTDSLRDGKSISYEQFGNITLPLFSKVEQNTIANFLDHETTKIDHLIEKQQQLIELLKEKRQAVISHAVTKGLDPNVPMKDSGVEWLGEVPEHWEVTRFAYQIFYQEGPGILAVDFHETGIPLLRIQNVKSDFVSNDYKTYLLPSKVLSKWDHYRVEKGDLIISCSASTGLVSEVDESTVGAIPYTGLIRLKPRTRKIISQYIKLLVQSDLFFEQIEVLQTGSTIQHFGPFHLQQMYISLPPNEEQEVICLEVKNRVRDIENLILKAESAIQLMQERRTALISAAVTGKIDVRNWQAPTLAGAQTELSA